MRTITPEDIDGLLPQTQCGLCGYGGCMPYAEALAFENAAINLCPPGGVPTLQALGELLEEDHTPFVAEMERKTKSNLLATIREAECIGCTKCIQACPVDAIIGSAKQMHTIITAECTGCELCVPVCPVDCIEMLIDLNSTQQTKSKRDLARARFNAKQKRLTHETAAKNSVRQKNSLLKKRAYIKEAIARVRMKKLKLQKCGAK